VADDTEAQVAELKKRIASLQAKRARAEQDQAVARDRAEQAEKAIRDEFGVSLEEVPALSVKLEADLAAEVEQVRQLLEKAEEKA
jgi:hypothetical protein